MELIQLSWLDHLLAILFAIVLPLFAIFKSQPKIKKIRFTTPIKISVYLSNSLSLWIGVIIILVSWYFLDRSLAQMGLALGPMKLSVVSTGLIALFVVLYLGDMLYKTLIPKERVKLIDKWANEIPFLPATQKELNYFYILSFSAGVCEEIIFRGFLINYILALFSANLFGTILAILLPGLIFAVSHIYQGWAAVFKIVLMALIFGTLFILMESLWPLIILHTLVDMISGTAAYKLLSQLKPKMAYAEEEE